MAAPLCRPPPGAAWVRGVEAGGRLVVRPAPTTPQHRSKVFCSGLCSSPFPLIGWESKARLMPPAGLSLPELAQRVLCCAVPWCAMPCHAKLCHTVPCSAMPCCAVPCQHWPLSSCSLLGPEVQAEQGCVCPSHLSVPPRGFPTCEPPGCDPQRPNLQEELGEKLTSDPRASA